MFCRKIINRIDNKPNKSIALISDTFQNCSSIYYRRLIIHTKHTILAGVMSMVCCSNQQFTGHTTYSGAGCSIGISFDQDKIISVLPRLAVSTQTRSASSNDGNIDVTCFHLILVTEKRHLHYKLSS